jgi:uncharacterized membrane protein YdjX (TVP38/TMEM64 family)
MIDRAGESSSGSLVTRRYGNVTWDRVLRATGLVGLAAIPAAVYFPWAGALAGFFLITIWFNGPLAPFLPASYEPVLMLTGRLYPPLLIATLGVLGTLYVEHLNYHLYRHILHLEALSRVRESSAAQRVLRLFRRAPFFTIWLCSFTPLPYWVVRFLSPLAGYPVGRHLLATFIGRFPRLWFFAALGLYWHISAAALLTISFAAILAAVAVALTRWRRASSQQSSSLADPA